MKKKLAVLAGVLLGFLTFSSGALAGVGQETTLAASALFQSFDLQIAVQQNWWAAILEWLQQYFSNLGGNEGGSGGGSHAVPEIDAMGGVIALSLFAGLLAMLRERKVALKN